MHILYIHYNLVLQVHVHVVGSAKNSESVDENRSHQAKVLPNLGMLLVKQVQPEESPTMKTSFYGSQSHRLRETKWKLCTNCSGGDLGGLGGRSSQKIWGGGTAHASVIRTPNIWRSSFIASVGKYEKKENVIFCEIDVFCQEKSDIR